MIRKIGAFFKKDLVFTIAVGLALLSMLLVPPHAGYLGYIDFRVLCILFSLMCVVAGFQKCGLLTAVSQRLLTAAHTLRGMSLLLVILCFFSSMLLTNDVTLIAFVPLTLVMLQTVHPFRRIYLIVLETVAANLGSMLTPIGNPQNLYLYTHYHMSIGPFLRTVAPVWLFSLLLVLGLVWIGKNQPVIWVPRTVSLDRFRLALYLAFFLICCLTVLRVVDYRLCMLLILAMLLAFDRPVLRRIDYRLIGTFVAFFIVVGNLGSLAPVREAMARWLPGRELWTTVLVSQVSSNVPAAILLSRFTLNGDALLLGSNLGGLGSLVASLASLISYKWYVQSPEAKPLRYLGVFTLVNVGMLVVLGAFVYGMGFLR